MDKKAEEYFSITNKITAIKFKPKFFTDICFSLLFTDTLVCFLLFFCTHIENQSTDPICVEIIDNNKYNSFASFSIILDEPYYETNILGKISNASVSLFFNRGLPYYLFPYSLLFYLTVINIID